MNSEDSIVFPILNLEQNIVTLNIISLILFNLHLPYNRLPFAQIVFEEQSKRPRVGFTVLGDP
jgi:hypothetical protein